MSASPSMNIPDTELVIPEGKNLFVVMGMMRSGSNLLQQKLNAIEGVLCHGEVFNAAQTGLDWKFEKSVPPDSLLKTVDRRSEPIAYLNSLIELSNGEHIGFRLFESHHNDLISPLIRDSRIFKIILIRDMLESYVSLQLARQTDQWIMNNPGTRKEWKPIQVNFDSFKTYALRQILFYYEILSHCMITGQHCLTLDYNNLNDPSTDAALLNHFGTHRDVLASKVTAQRQNPEPLAQKVANFEDIKSRIQKARLDRWLLAKPPLPLPLGE